MRQLLLLFSLLVFLDADSLYAAKPFDVEESESLDQLAVAVMKRLETPAGRGSEAPPRASEERTVLALIPVDGTRADIVTELGRIMKASGAITVVDPAKAAAFLKALPPEKDPVRELAAAFNLDAVAAVKGYPTGGKLLILVRIHAIDSGRPETVAALVAASPALTGGSKNLRVVEERDPPDPPFTARYYRAADLDGDGVREYAMSDGRSLSVYRIDGEEWRLLWAEPRLPKTREGRHIYLDAADVNGNGKKEIFVTILDGTTAFSRVYEEEGGAFRQKAEIPGFVRVISFPGRDPALIGQGYHEERMFDGSVRRFSWRDGGYVAGDAVLLPKGVGLYGFVAADFGESKPLMVTFDDEDRLRVYSGDELIWRSEERYKSAETVLVESTPDIYSMRRRIAIPAKISAVDIDSDGKAEILVARTTEKMLSGEARKAEIQGLRWTGARLEKVLTVNDVPGAVLDFQAEQRTPDGLLIEALIRTQGGILSKPGSRMKIYSLR